MDFDVAFKNFVSLLLRKDRFATLLEALQRPVEVGVVDDERDEDANDVASQERIVLNQICSVE